MAYIAEAEIGASFINAQELVPERTTLIKTVQKQPQTRIQVDNTTDNAFARKTLNQNQNQTKAIKMRFYWIQDRCYQGQLQLFCIPGTTNLGDYHTNHHYSSHHQLICHKYLHR